MRFQRLATSDLPADKRLDDWVRFGRQALFDMVVVPQAGERFEASLSRADIGNLSFTWTESTAACAQSPADKWGGPAASSTDFLLLHMPQYGFPIMRSEGQAVALSPGDLLIRSFSHDWATRFPDRVGMVSVKIPTALFVERVDDPERMLGKVIRAGSGPSSITAAVFTAVRQLLETPLEESWDAAIADVLLSSLSLVSRNDRLRGELRGAAASHHAVRQQCRQFVELHFADPDLTVTTLSQGVGISLRMLQRAFLAAGETPRAYINRIRIERAMEMLQSRLARTSTITDIAFAVGFNDLSSFTRSFTKHYGRSPRHFAQVAQVSAADDARVPRRYS